MRLSKLSVLIALDFVSVASENGPRFPQKFFLSIIKLFLDRKAGVKLLHIETNLMKTTKCTEDNKQIFCYEGFFF